MPCTLPQKTELGSGSFQILGLAGYNAVRASHGPRMAQLLRAPVAEQL
jgi:hypothetical protein